MTDKELKDIAVRIQLDGWTGCALPLLRSIEIAALREAKELVEKIRTGPELSAWSILEDVATARKNLERQIQQLELK